MIASVRPALFALALGLLPAAAWSQGVTAHTLVLGQSAPLSGPLQGLGEDVRSGALAYLRRLNDAGGVHGRRLELATLDDAGDAGRALPGRRRQRLVAHCGGAHFFLRGPSMFSGRTHCSNCSALSRPSCRAASFSVELSL